MFEKLRDYLKMQVKTAYHTITKSFRLYLPLFLAILIIESLLFCVILSFRNNIETRHQTIAETYDHHLVISGLTESEMIVLNSDNRSTPKNQCFDVIKTIRYDSAHHDPTFTVYVKLVTGNKGYGIFALFIDDSLETNYNTMLLRYGDVFGTEEYPNQNLTYFFTPLYTEEDVADSMKASCAISLLAISCASALVFSYLYRIYVNDRKFAFGLYSAFGAARRDLRRNAMAEFLIIALFVMLPAYYISAIVCHAFFHQGGVSFSFPWISLSLWIMVLFIVFFILIFSISVTIRKISVTDPMKLLSGEENENPITSPKRSVSLLKRRFPLGYEGISLLRFRRHHISLAIFSALLCVVFVFGSYLSLTQAESIRLARQTDTHFSVHFTGDTQITPEHLAVFKNIEGVSSVYTKPSESHARDHAALLAVSEENIARGSGLGKDKENGIYFTGDVRFISGAEDTVAGMSAIYQTTGNTSLFATMENAVVLGKTFENRDTFDFAVGDTVRLLIPKTEAITDEESGQTTYKILYKDENTPRIENLTGKDLWAAQYERFVWEYEEFTVVGIIEDYPSATQGIPMIIHPDAFQKITGTTPNIDTVRIRINESAGGISFTEVEGYLRSAAGRIGNCVVESHDNYFENNIKSTYCYDALIRVITYGFLLFVPIIWIYAQNLFFKKREREFYILNAISAPPSAIKKIYFSGSLMMIPVAILSLGFSVLLYGILSLFFDRFLPNVFGIESTVVTSVAVPTYVYLIGIFTTLIFCIISAAIPYFTFRRRNEGEKVAADFQSEEQ